MIIAIIGSVKFHLKPDKHTVEYARRAEAREFGDAKAMLPMLRAVMAQDEQAAARLLANELKNYLFRLNPEDFTFTMKTEPVEGGHFWLMPSGCSLQKYKAAGGDAL